MRIIISPAKKMNYDVETLVCIGLPKYINHTEVLMKYLQGLSFQKAKDLWKCNDKIVEQNIQRLQSMDLYQNLTPAILSYEGIQYQYMAPTVFEDGMLDYVQQHLRILSGFYGVLKPMDGVTPYRLEMQAKMCIGEDKNLYDFWNHRLYDQVVDEDGMIINLASKEYAKCIEKYLKPTDTYITCVFGELVEGKVVQKGTYAKMARGEMVRYMAENRIYKLEDIKVFDRLGYCYKKEYSDERKYVFIK
ncbi:MAG: peroxide stress protein YaaA [Eubacteriales bacterium]